ncbi:hypothetical protein H072_3157 [Dactylellina haptotyla CBS 200.50]|uniref:Impact N-terminal domain-containing protein n=1 Tax=Dactylellina haptotyla (strain CBS 200.50) TaxID=1284197 RepID=S8C5E1_DACHA|nr:hypothetical protein H072_3157 [Dactylellina haptotyla CBS 200.50]
MPPKRPLSPPSYPASSALYVSKTIEDRASSFSAYFSPTYPQRQLQAHPDLSTASHRILAWRKPSSSQKTLTGFPTYNTGFDDDGEAYAGKKLLKLLDDYKVEGSIVVARWYGGKLLGPVRFQHIETTAKEAIRAYLADKGEETSSQVGESAKKTKISEEDESKKKEDLAEELKNRDESIVVLRALLDEKMGKGKQTDPESSQSQSEKTAMKAKEIDYTAMPLDRLKQIDKARDNTIAFLLKKIDEMEAKESLQDEKPSSPENDSNKTISKT